MGVINYTCRRPVGVAGQITPWNLPLYLLTFKIAPALAVGCTVVCKPSEMTSLTAFMLAEVMKEIGLSQMLIYHFFCIKHCFKALEKEDVLYVQDTPLVTIATHV